MYIVSWNDHEGNYQEMYFDTLEDANLEAEYLDEWYDGVDIREEAKGWTS